MTLQDDTLDLDQELPDEQEDTDVAEPKPEAEPESAPPPPKPRMVSYEEAQRMAQKRIDKITYERNIERDARAKLEQELADVRKSHAETETRYQESSVAALARERDSIKAALKQAFDNAEYDKVPDLQERLAEIATDIRLSGKVPAEHREASQQAQAQARQPAEQPRQQSQQQTHLHPETAAWLERNQWVNDKRNRAIYGAAYAITQDLADEGYEIGPELYQELDRRLEQEAPRVKRLRAGSQQSVTGRASSPVGAPSRGNEGVANPAGSADLDARDIAEMKKFGMDPGDPRTGPLTTAQKAARRMWADAKRSSENA